MYRIFSRTINILRDKYLNMVRVESISFDPLVSKYFEAEYITTKDGATQKRNTGNNTTYHRLGEQIQDYGETDTKLDLEGHEDSSREIEGTNTEKINEEGSNSKSGSSTRSEQSTSNNTVNGTSSSSTTGSTSDRTTTNTNRSGSTTGTESEIDHNAVKAAPMNASGVGIGADGKLEGLNFGFASSYGQNDVTKSNSENTTGAENSSVNGTGSSSSRTSGTSGSSGQTTGNVNGSDNRSESGSNSNERTGNYTNLSHQEDGKLYGSVEYDNESHNNFTIKSGVNTDESVLNGTVDGTSNENTLQRDRYAGRDGVLPQDAMAAATHYLMTYSTAFQWLCNKLESCFIGIYDI